ncbi:MAG: hypothetical protein HY420_00225 [Candidatus Kerfeldbacteria bacterium]|nr:hypothetical protein [Candidatus Kerfeldbacteria bacterium]
MVELEVLHVAVSRGDSEELGGLNRHASEQRIPAPAWQYAVDVVDMRRYRSLRLGSRPVRARVTEGEFLTTLTYGERHVQTLHLADLEFVFRFQCCYDNA